MPKLKRTASHEAKVKTEWPNIQDHPVQEGMVDDSVDFLVGKLGIPGSEMKLHRLVSDDKLDKNFNTQTLQRRLFVTEDSKSVYVKRACPITSEQQVRDASSVALQQLAQPLRFFGFGLESHTAHSAAMILSEAVNQNEIGSVDLASVGDLAIHGVNLVKIVEQVLPDTANQRISGAYIFAKYEQDADIFFSLE